MVMQTSKLLHTVICSLSLLLMAVKCAIHKQASVQLHCRINSTQPFFLYIRSNACYSSQQFSMDAFMHAWLQCVQNAVMLSNVMTHSLFVDFYQPVYNQLQQHLHSFLITLPVKFPSWCSTNLQQWKYIGRMTLIETHNPDMNYKKRKRGR